MKTLFLSAFLILSQTAFGAEREFHCEARYVFGDKDKATLAGTITSNTSLLDVVYSIDDQVEFDSGLITIDKSDMAKRYAFYTPFKVSESAYTLYLPEKMDSLVRFTAIVGNERVFEKLDCEIE